MTAQTNRAWICAVCRRQVPGRIERCRCGASRSSAPWQQPGEPRRRASPIVLTALGVAIPAFGMLLTQRQVPAALDPAPRAIAPRVASVRQPPAAPSAEAPVGGDRWGVDSPRQPETASGSLAPPDRLVAEGIRRRVNRGVATTDDIIRAETLLIRYSEDPALRQLLRSLLLVAAEQGRLEGDFEGAKRLLADAEERFPGDAQVLRAAVHLLVQTRDWPAAEATARRLLEHDPASVEGRRGLALALAARGDDRGAIRAIFETLELVTDPVNEPQLRDLRDQVERRLWITSGCDPSQRRDPPLIGSAAERAEEMLAFISSCAGGAGPGRKLAHFSVSYKRTGDDVLFEKLRARIVSIDSVGRDVLNMLEREYSTLTTTLEWEMTRTIPVVILEDAEYRASTGAPAWAGGQYDKDDATITVPVGLLARLETGDPEWERLKDQSLERILVHETAHAFIDDITRGTAPRLVDEGLAQVLQREVTGDRSKLSQELEQAAGAMAQGQYPGGSTEQQDARDSLKRQALRQLLEEVRTTGMGHAGTVRSLYIGGELFVDFLIGQRGMGGIQELLRAMGTTRSVDSAFEQVYGRGYDGIRREWLDSLRRQWGVGQARR